MTTTLNVYEVRGLKASGDQIYVKTKWKIGSSLQEHKSAELPASSNAVFSPPHQVNLGVLSDNGLKINFAVKASATLIAKTLGTGDATVATIMAADGGRYTVSMGGISVTCSIDAPAELRARAASLTQQRAAASSAPSTATVAAQALFETEDHADMPQKTGLSSLAGNFTGMFTKAKGGGDAGGAEQGNDAAEADDDEDDTQQDRFELKAPENPPAIKRGPYRVYVHLHEARDMRSSSDPAKRHKFPEPVFTVLTCGKKEHTKRKKKCQACLLNQLFIFDFEQKDTYDMDLEKVTVQLSNSKGFTDDLVAVFELDMSIIYHQDKHELANCWIAMSDPKGESSEIMAFLKLSVAVIGEGDELPAHDDDEDDEGENSMEMTKCLMPPALEQEKRCWQIVALKAAGLPHQEGLKLGGLSTLRHMNFFVLSSFGGLKCRTATFKGKKEQELNPFWFEMMTLPFNMPTFSENLSVAFFNYHKPTHEIVATLNFKLKDVTMNPRKFNVATWYHLYGSPVVPSIGGASAAATDSMNKGVREGIEYKGRVLLTLQHRLSDDIQRESGGKGSAKHVLSTKGMHKLGQRAKEQWLQFDGKNTTLRLRITVYEGHELMGDRDGKVFVAVAFGQAGANRERQYDSMENIYRTDPVDVTKGVHQFYSSAALPDVELQHVMTRDDEHPLEGAPDVFCYVYEKATLGGCKRLGYIRLSARDYQGTSNVPKWHKVTKDPYSDDLTFTGYLLMDVSVNTRQAFDEAGLAAARPKQIKPPTMRHYVLVSQVYLGRGLPSADSNGLSDPFVEVHLGGLSVKTHPIYNTLNPSWYTTVTCEVEVPEEKSLRRQITCIVRDANQGAARALETITSSIGIKTINTFLGRCDIPLDAVTARQQSPKWYELHDPATGGRSGEGRLLMGFQLINREDFDEHSINREIRPAFEPNCTLHICALGCRALASYGFRPVNNSLVEMDCVDAEAKTHSVKSRNSSQPTGSDPNFCQILKMKLALPRDANYAPVLTIRAVDHRLFGASKPTVGSCSISLDSHVFALFNERDKGVGSDPMIVGTGGDEDADLAAALDKMTPEEIDALHEQMAAKKREKERKARAQTSFNPLLEEDEGAEDLHREPTVGSIDDAETVRVTGPDLVVEGEDIVLSDDEDGLDDKPHYMTVNGKQREELKTTVDAKTGAPPFDSFALMRGRAKGRGFLSRLLKTDAPANVGAFKASIVITRAKEQASAAATALALSVLPKTSDLTPRLLVVRVYVLKGFRLFNGDSGGGSEMNTYVKIGLGGTVISRRDVSRKGNDNVEYFQAFEIAATLPGIALLNVSIMEKNVFGFDTLVGTGIIDLENRWFSKKWRALQPKPVEQIALRLPTSKLPQGKVSLWVDIMSNAESTSSPFYDISPPPPIKFEIRLVLWKAKDMTCRDTVRRQNDLFLVADLTSLELALQTMREETDTHWFATDGNGSFNWRIKFNVTLPMKKARLTLQAWDSNFISNDAIGERIIPMTSFLKRAYMAQVNKLKASQAPPAAPSGSKPAKRPPIRPLGNGGDSVARFPKKGKGFKGEGNPTYWAELYNGTKDGSGKFLPQGQIEMELACLTQDDADIRPVGSGRDDPNRDPEMPRPERVKWSLLHPLDMLADIMGPHMWNKFKRYICLIFCLSVTFSLLYFIGPLISGNVLGALAGKGVQGPPPAPPPS